MNDDTNEKECLFHYMTVPCHIIATFILKKKTIAELRLKHGERMIESA